MGPRIGLITNSGALKSLASEAADGLGVAFPELSEGAGEKIAALLPDVELSNPLDTKRTLSTEQYMGIIAAVHDDPAVDMVLVAEELPRAAGLERKLKNFSALDAYIAATASKPVVCFSPVTTEQNDYMQGLRRDMPHIAWMRDLSKTLRVASSLALSRYPALHQAPHSQDSLARHKLQALAKTTGSRSLDEHASKDILRLFGFGTPGEIFVAKWNFDQVAQAAAKLGFPVVAKVVCGAIAHKSDVGLVILNIADAADLQKAYDRLAQRCAERSIAAEGLLIAQHMSGGIETVVGLHRDPEMGPVVMFGAGGVLLELIGDVAFGPPGLDAARARDMIQSTRVAKLLGGYRGSAPCDLEALVRALVAMGALAYEVTDLVDSVEINPLLVRPDGAYALDGLIVMSEPAPSVMIPAARGDVR